MRFNLDIDYSVEKMELSRKRFKAREQFKYTDRVPVFFCVLPRYFAPALGLRYIVQCFHKEINKNCRLHYSHEDSFGQIYKRDHMKSENIEVSKSICNKSDSIIDWYSLGI